MNAIAQTIYFSLMFGAFCFVAGLLMRGVFSERIKRREYEMGREDGFYEALLLSHDDRREERRHLQLVKK